MSNRTFFDMYSDAWNLAEKSKLKFWEMQKLKQCLNQMLKTYQGALPKKCKGCRYGDDREGAMQFGK